MNIACLLRNMSVLEAIRTALRPVGFNCIHYASEVALFRALSRQEFDLILVDFPALPGADDTILSWLKCRSGSDTPVLGVAPVRCAKLAVTVLGSGADDVLARPFEAVELAARANALIRRYQRRTVCRKIELAGFTLDRDNGTFAFQGTPIDLTSREFGLAWMFFSSPGVFISRETIGTSIWSADSEVAGRTIEQHVYKLRKKLQLGPERGASIRTAYGQGYRLELLDQAH
jgi:DNA-binding response OmpR family regulator